MVDKKTVFNTTDIFKGKVLPPFLKAHPLFTAPTRITKVFSSIGMPNFKQETNIAKCMVDVKKEGSYVWNLIHDVSSECNRAKEQIGLSSQKTQFLAPLEERLAKKAKLNEVAQIVQSLSFLAETCDPRSASAFHPTNGVVSSNGGKIDLRLNANIVGGDSKVLYKAGIPIFRLYKQLRDKCIEHGVPENSIMPLDAIESYKIFSKENIPNKKYQIVFSSDGEEGAWDLITMSMRGTRSCQRWEGEYPKCLIGSVVSKFVGIIYLTSGVAADPVENHGSLGTKMMRRSIVRYAFDKDANTPCLVMDKMYPAEDDEIVKTFMDTLAEKSKLPVYYGPRLQNKTRHIYIPNEKITTKITAREKSYQDTALRTKCELDAHLLTHNQTELEKYAQRVQSNFSLFLSSKFEDIQYNNTATPPDSDLKKMVNNFTLSAPFSVVADALVAAIFAGFNAPKTTEHYSVRSYNKEYLKACFLQRKNMIFYSKARIDAALKLHCSRDYSIETFSKNLSDMIVEFVKKELSYSILNR
jgi:hypothetical protein